MTTLSTNVVCRYDLDEHARVLANRGIRRRQGDLGLPIALPQRNGSRRLVKGESQSPEYTVVRSTVSCDDNSAPRYDERTPPRDPHVAHIDYGTLDTPSPPMRSASSALSNCNTPIGMPEPVNTRTARCQNPKTTGARGPRCTNQPWFSDADPRFTSMRTPIPDPERVAEPTELSRSGLLSQLG